MPTPYQRELLTILREQGFSPKGYDKHGHLVVAHPSGFQTAIYAKSSDSHSRRNFLAKVTKGVQLAESVPAKFERWMWEKWNIPPGTEKPCQLSLSKEYNEFWQAKRDVLPHGIVRNQVMSRVRKSPNFKNMTGKNGHNPNEDPNEPSRRIWLISQPEVPEVVRPWVNQPEEPAANLTSAERQDLKDFKVMPVVEPAPPQDAQGAQAEAVQAEVEGATTAESLGLFDPELVEMLRRALARPLMIELATVKDSNSLLLEELSTQIRELSLRIDELVAMRERLQTVLDVVQG